MALAEYLLHDILPTWNIRFIAVVDHIDTQMQSSRKARQISSLVNQWYLEDLSENIRAVLDSKRRQGDYIGSRPLFGYQKSPDNHNRLIPDPPAARVVQKIFELFLDGMGCTQIAAFLNRREIPSPAAYRESKTGVEKTSKQAADNSRSRWSKTAVLRILKNEMYTGTLIQGKKRKISYKSRKCAAAPPGEWYRTERAHPPIVSKTVYERAQARFGPCRSRQPVKRACLEELIFCGRCRRKLSLVSSGNHRYFRCCTHYHAKTPEEKACPGVFIRQDYLWEILWRRIDSLCLEAGGDAVSGFTPAQREKLLSLLIARVEVTGRTRSGHTVCIYWKI